MEGLFAGINAIEFARQFKKDEDCYYYLMNLKWGSGFICVRCGSDKCGKGRTSYYKRCKQCKYDESVFANTIFHDMRIPVLKAFHMAYRVICKKKGMSSVELSTEVNVQQKTAWLFKRKVQVVMQDKRKIKLKNEVVADETLVGGGRRGSYGRHHNEKAIIHVAVEKLPDNKTGNIALEPIKSFKLEAMLHAVNENVEADATLYADDFPTNRGIKKRRPNTELIVSKGSLFFEELHKQIMMFKMWLSGIHHKCSEKHISGYTSEYTYRFNRRNQRKWILNNLLADMIYHKPSPYKAISALCELNA